MKTTAQFIATKTIGGQTSQQFTIATSAKAFKVLSDSLYSDKIATVIRELSTNAYDSHVEAGKKDVPFDVQFPNNIDPTFLIRDYGVGLSFDDTMNLYSTYFFSTKTNTNEQIGALGLGSKSPFGYTDGFTVTSYFNGDKMVFNCNLSEDGIPTITHIISVETQEPNGLEVSFAVKQQNFFDFRQKASLIWRHFNPSPNITGVLADEFSINKREYVSEGTGWKLFSERSYNIKPIAVMGLIEYTIEYNKLVDITSEERAQMQNMPIEVQFDIGELDISTNRESLSYDTRTSRNLVNKVISAFGEIVEVIQQDINKCKTLWDAHIKYRTIIESNYDLRTLISNKNVHLLWNDVKVQSNVLINLYHQDNDISGNVVISKFEEYRTRNYDTKLRQCKYSKNHETNSNLTIPSIKSVEIYIDDIGRGAPARIKAYMVKNEIKKNIYLLQYASNYDIDYILKTVGMKSFKLVSDLPKIARAPRIKGHSNSINVWIMDYQGFANTNSWHSKISRHFTKAVDLDLTDGGIYVTLDRLQPHNMSGFDSFVSFQSLIKTAQELNILNPDIKLIGVAHGHKDKLVKFGKWKELTSLVKHALTVLSVDPVFIKDMGIINVRKNIWQKLNINLNTTDNICASNINAVLNYFNDNINIAVPKLKTALKYIELLVNYDLSNSIVNKSDILHVMTILKLDIKPVPIKVSIEQAINNIIKLAPITRIVFTDINMVVGWSGRQYDTVKEEKLQLFVDIINENNT